MPLLRHRPGDVDGDVRARLVDDEQHAERDAHLLDVEPVRQPPAGDDVADGSSSAATARTASHSSSTRSGVERQAVEQRARLPGGAGRREILGVGLDDRRGLALERERDLLERRVLGAAAERRQRARGGAGAGARGFSRHCHRGAPDYRDGWPRGRRRRPSAARPRGAARRCPWPRRPVANTLAVERAHAHGVARPERPLDALHARPAAGSRRARRSAVRAPASTNTRPAGGLP